MKLQAQLDLVVQQLQLLSSKTASREDLEEIRARLKQSTVVATEGGPSDLMQRLDRLQACRGATEGRLRLGGCRHLMGVVKIIFALS